MKFVELVEQVRWRCSVSGRPITSLETGLRDEAMRLKGWVAEADEEIQGMKDEWRFRIETASHRMEANSNVASSREFEAGDVQRWILETVRIADPGQGRGKSTPLACMDWHSFITGPGLNPRVYGKPYVCAIRPQDGALVMAPSADDQYILYYDYLRAIQTMVNSDDESIIPADYHLLIVYMAMISYADYEAANEVRVAGIKGRNRLMNRLMKSQLPGVSL